MNFPSIASTIALYYSRHFSQILNNHILAEKLLVLPNITPLLSPLLSVLKKNLFAPADLQGNENL